MSTRTDAPRIYGNEGFVVKKIVCSAVCAALTPMAAAASTVEVTVDLNVIQDVLVTAVGDPSYQDPFSGDFIFFDEYVRVLTDEVDLFDDSVIPATPQQASPNALEMPGQIELSFGVDVAAIDTSNLVGANFDSVGSTDLGAAATVTAPSVNQYHYVGTPIDILAVDNIIDPNGIARDALFFNVFDNVVGPSGSVENVFFAMAFDGNYFDTLGLGQIDFTQAVFGYFESDNHVNDFNGNPLFDERVEGFGTNISVSAYDGVVGLGPVVAPVPLPAGLPLMAGGLLAFGLMRRR